MISGLIQNIHYGLRSLARSPGYAAVAILTLALGIGANTAVFSFLNGALLKPLPYPEPEQVVRVLEQNARGGWGVTALDFLDWQAQSKSFQFLAGQTLWTAAITGLAEPRVLRGMQITARYFDIARIQPLLGRTFLPEEEQQGKDRVVVLSHRTYINVFGADPAIVGKSIQVNGQPFIVVGVMPAAAVFDGGYAEIWKPLAFQAEQLNRSLHWFGAFGRLKPGVTIERARAEMNSINGNILQAHPDTNNGWYVTVDRFGDILLTRGARRALLILMTAAGLLLLAACVNLANLALARGSARQREVAVRLALGAGRGRLAGQFMAEAIVLALAGGACGVALGYVLMQWLNTQIPPGVLPGEIVVDLDIRVLLFAAGVSVFTGVLFGLAPAFQAGRANLAGVMKDGARGASAAGGGRLRNIFVITEVALAFVLLVCSGLLMRSFFGLLNSNPGFESANVLTMSLPTPLARYPSDERLNTYLREIARVVNAVPGVTASAFTSVLPLRGWGYLTPIDFPSLGVRERPQRPTAFIKMVSPTYFESLGIRFLRGRGLTASDTRGAPRVLVINATLAKRFFDGKNPLGQKIVLPEIHTSPDSFGPDQTWEIVGVMADEKITALSDEVSRGVYVSQEQVAFYNPTLVVRAAGNPHLIEKTVRQAILSVNKDQPVSDVMTMDEIKDEVMAADRIETLLLGGFAALGLLLAASGIYGVMSYSVSQRTNELGIRAALGASGRKLHRLVLSHGILLTVIGLGLGFCGALAFARLMASMLYGVGPQDPTILMLTAAILFGVAAVACYLPARRATRVDPMTALRHE